MLIPLCWPYLSPQTVYVLDLLAPPFEGDAWSKLRMTKPCANPSISFQVQIRTSDRISHKCMEAILGWELTCDVFVGDWSQGWTQLAGVKYDTLFRGHSFAVSKLKS